VTTRYKILFSIELQNEYYSSLRCRDFSMMPSTETAALMRNQQMLYKVVGNSLVVLIKVNEADEPFVIINPDHKFLFYLALANPVFTTITNLDFDRFPRERYYFSNLTENRVADSLFISAPIGVYNNALAYKPGDLADDSTGNIFECIQTTGGGNDTTNGSFWHLRGEARYASGFDMLKFVTRVSTFFTAATATSFSIAAFGLNPATNLYDREFKLSRNVHTSGAPTNIVQADLTGLPNGRYILDINGEIFDVFVDDEAVYNNIFGVIEIFCHLPAGDDFALLDNAGKVKDQKVLGLSTWLRFQLRFANRLAYWKYVSLRNGIDNILDNTGSYNFSGIPLPPPPLPPPPSDMFLSNIPIPLHETPKVFNLDLTSSHSSEPPAAQNPDPNITGMLTRSNNDYYCNIYLNY
jgi:hypothetical protein